MEQNNDEPSNHQKPKDKQPEKWLDNQDILTLLNISDRTLQNWRSKGYIPFHRVGRGKIFYKESDLLLVLEKGKVVKGGK